MLDHQDIVSPSVADATAEPPRLRSLAHLRRFGRDQDIYGQDERCDSLYRVVSGSARKYLVRADGRRQLVDIYLPGDLFGLTSRLHHKFAVQAVADETLVACYPRQRVEALAVEDPATANEIRWQSFEAIARLQEQLLVVGTITAQEKVREFLVYFYDRISTGVWAYVNGWDKAKKRTAPTKGKRPPRNTDPELRRKVEEAAVRHAWKYYEAKYGKGCVESFEPYSRGWDLEVRSGDVEWLVEVKGLLNAGLACELSPNEYEKMCSPDYCARYVVYVVNNALAEEPEAPVPSVFTWNGGQTWRTEDGRELQVVEKVGAVLTCK